VIIDIGEANDIHPRNKRDVGLRLALLALAKTYHKAIAWSGPEFRQARIEPKSMRIVFDHADDLRTSDGRAPVGFQIAGRDQRWVWATARIDGRDVIVESPLVPSPVAVRYAWSNNPDANLTNKTGLPAGPFRSDDWPGITDKNR
jgi:sialate O-acetylesterase